ncbi:MAG: ABC transporter substrate-binding protein [Treponema sp.]
MKRLLVAAILIALLVSCTAKNEIKPNTEQPVLKIGAIKDFKRSLEGSTLVFDTLLQMTPDYQPLPNIITEWTRNDTATEYDFTVRNDILFSDGTPLTAQTVKWDIENVAPITWCVFSSLLKEVSITDAAHLKITLTAPYYFLPQDLALVTAIKENGVDEALNTTDFTGTGAYIVKEYHEGQSASLVKNEAYWNKAAAPSIPLIEWHVITNENARNSALSSGQIDVLGISKHYLSIQYPSIDDLLKTKKMSFIEEPKEAFTSLIAISFNWKEGFCSDKTVREALEYGIDRQTLVDTIFLDRRYVIEYFCDDLIVMRKGEP